MTLRSKLELAFGADLTANSASWTWTDVTTYALGDVHTTHGRVDEGSTTGPASMTCRLRNTDGRFTPRGTGSPTWPYMRKRTPVRYSMAPSASFGDNLVFQGYVDEITPTWPASNDTVAEVEITASGALRRLVQGDPTVQSAIYRSTSRAPNVVAYAPLEENSSATQLRAVDPLPQNVLSGGTVSAGAETSLAGTKQAITLNDTSFLAMSSGNHVFGGHWQIDWFMKFAGVNPTVETIVMRGYTTNAAATLVDAVYGGGFWGIRVYDVHGAAAGSSIFTIPAGLASGWWHWRLMAGNAAATTDYQLVVFPVGGSGFFALSSIASGGAGNLSSSAVLPAVLQPAGASLSGVSMAQYVHYDTYNFSAVDSSAGGYEGEYADDRMSRLCQEEGVELTLLGGSSSVRMGPQRPASLLSLLRDCEAADGGILYDGLSAGLTYLPESQRYNLSPTLALDCKRQQVKVPFTPTDDDQGTVNDVTLSNPAGQSAQYVDEDHVAANDRYQSSATVNLRNEDLLRDAASWRVHLGTVEEMRVPQLELELIDHAELWLATYLLAPGVLVTVDHLMGQYPPGTLSVVVEGYSVTYSSVSWKITLNCSPGSPWATGVLDSAWLDCDASVTGSTMTTTSTTVDVLISDACNWTHADGNYSITIGGEEMTVTAVSATSTPTPALVAAGTAAAADGSITQTVTPGLPGGATAAGNLLLLLASCRDTNAIDTDMYITGAPGWKRIFDGLNFAVFGKVHSGSETAPTVGISSAITGDTLVAQIASFSGKWGDPASQLIAAVQQFNAAAQDIAYPSLNVPLSGTLIVTAGWKADDWTSVATLAGQTEIGEPDSTAGNDAGIVWDYIASSTATTTAAGSFTVTGGGNAISRGAVLALRSVYQTLTVVRGVNGVTRAHALGEEVHVTDPILAARQ